MIEPRHPDVLRHPPNVAHKAPLSGREVQAEPAGCGGREPFARCSHIRSGRDASRRYGRRMQRMRRLVRCVLRTSSAVAAPVVIVHRPSAQFLGPGLLLVGRDDALEFADAQEANRLLARWASEPCYEARPADEALATLAA